MLEDTNSLDGAHIKTNNTRNTALERSVENYQEFKYRFLCTNPQPGYLRFSLYIVHI